MKSANICRGGWATCVSVSTSTRSTIHRNYSVESLHITTYYGPHSNLREELKGTPNLSIPGRSCHRRVAFVDGTERPRRDEVERSGVPWGALGRVPAAARGQPPPAAKAKALATRHTARPSLSRA